MAFAYGQKVPPGITTKHLITIASIVGGVFLFSVIMSSYYIIEPGHRGVLIRLGSVQPNFAPEGLGFKTPMITNVVQVMVKQQSATVRAECYSSDLQQLSIETRVQYRIPESSVISIYREYSGNPFDALIAPRVYESIKEVTAMQSAETIVKTREEIKQKALAALQKKLGNLLVIEDLVLQDISLSKELEAAIEAKMVQEQEAAKSKFVQQKAEIEAKTAVIKAQGEAEAIRIRGDALKQNPALVHLQIVEKWDGKAPLVVGGNGGSGSNIILPLGNLQR